MARTALPLLPLILSVLYIAATAASVPTTTNFITTSCKATRYPVECVQSLSAHAAAIQQSPQKLAQTALSVSLVRAQSTKSFMMQLANLRGLKANEHAALKDCLDEVEDSVDRLRQSARELEELGKAQGEDFLWHKSNIATWVSAAMTNHDACLEGFGQHSLEGKIRDSVRARLDNVERVTSNALALINRYPARN